MGKVFPYVSNLKERPEFIQETIKLIEESFQYEPQNSFTTDFAPLIDESNHHNCFILIDEGEKVICHIGVSEREIRIGDEVFPIALLGGIVVDKAQRGKGHFQTLMNEVMAEKRSEVCFFMLWSDDEKLYKKFGFYLCGEQYETSASDLESMYTKCSFFALDVEDKKTIRDLYESSFKDTYLSLERTEKDWERLSKITSADLFIERTEGKISSYFFMNKGQDLSGVIYEYGSSKNLKGILPEMASHGKIWSGFQLKEEAELQYGYFIAPADTKMFSRFVLTYSDSNISIRDINVMKQEVYFDFNAELYGLEVEELLRGLFGPGVFEELQGKIRPLFISGLDSI